jgi:hypothetical protein
MNLLDILSEYQSINHYITQNRAVKYTYIDIEHYFGLYSLPPTYF